MLPLIITAMSLKFTDVSGVRPDNGAIRTSETSVNFDVTTRRYIPEYSKFHILSRENLKSNNFLGKLFTVLDGKGSAIESCFSQKPLLSCHRTIKPGFFEYDNT
jgi:hypothetical protein